MKTKTIEIFRALVIFGCEFWLEYELTKEAFFSKDQDNEAVR